MSIDIDPAPAGIIIYYNDNTQLTLVGQGNGLRNKWRSADKVNITCVQVFARGSYKSWRKEKGEPGPAQNTYNYSDAMVQTDFYWYDEATGFYKHGDVVPPSVEADDIGIGIWSSNEYFMAVYNIAMEPARTPTGLGGTDPINPGGLPP